MNLAGDSVHPSFEDRQDHITMGIKNQRVPDDRRQPRLHLQQRRMVAEQQINEETAMSEKSNLHKFKRKADGLIACIYIIQRRMANPTDCK